MRNIRKATVPSGYRIRVFAVRANGVVRGKFAIASYKERPSFELMLQAASALVQNDRIAVSMLYAVGGINLGAVDVSS